MTEESEDTALTPLVKQTLLETGDDSDDEALDELLIENLSKFKFDRSSVALSASLSQSSLVDTGRRVSRSSLAWFQEQTSEAGLIGRDGQLQDDYIVKRQSINKPATLKTIPVLADLTDHITHVDGWVLTQLFLSGYAKMSSKIDELNKINVFPIADGDTGANMKVCLKLPTRNLLLDPSDSTMTVTSNLAADVLLNGQGNSGTILSHFFVSFAEEVKAIGNLVLTVDELAGCLVRTGEKMNAAVANPVEGTLLSVSRDACKGLQDDGHFSSLKDLLEAWTERANSELAKTPDQLVVNGHNVLKEAGVVDSGAQGFVYLVEGMLLASRGQLPEASDPSLFQTARVPSEEEATINVDHTVTNTKYRYCTEAVVLLNENSDKQAILDAVANCDEEGLGDSVACVGAPAKEGGHMVKLHIHSNEPRAVFDRLRPFSRDQELKKEKVEDMLAMREEMHGEDLVDLSDAKFTIMGMCSHVLSSLEMSDELFTLPVFMVPSTTQEPIDLRFTTDSETCIALNMQRHKSTAIQYTTAAPNPMQIKIELLAALAKGKPVLLLVFSMDKRVSALGRNAVAAVDLLTPEQRARVKVFVHGWGFYEGAFVREAMKCAQEGMTIEQTCASCKELSDRSFFFVSFSSSATVNKLVAWRPGLFPEGFSVEDGSYFSFGHAPVIREGEPLTEFQKAGMLMSLLDRAPSLEELMDVEASRIKRTLKPQQRIASLTVGCAGRPDYGYAFTEKLKALGVPIEGEPIVYNESFLCVATANWGDFTVLYKVVE